MNQLSNKKPVVFFMPGPLRLFWGTGFFLMWLLKDKYDFVIAAPSDYKNDLRFAKVGEFCDVSCITFFELPLTITGHLHCSRAFKDMARSFSPRFLLLHNINYPENQYAIEAFRSASSEIPVVMYQNGRWPVDWFKVVKLSLEFSSRKVSSKLKLPVVWGEVIVRCGRAIKNILDLRILPLFLQGKIFHPLIDQRSSLPWVSNIKRFSASQSSMRLFILGFNEIEIEAYRRSIIPCVLQSQHPVGSVGGEAFEFLYGVTTIENQIAILPSMGLPSSLFDDSDSLEQKAEKISSRWISALEILRNRTGYRLVVKVHPLAQKDPLWLRIVEQIRQSISDVEVLPSSLPVEGIILSSKIVISDVSTALLWASYLGGRVVISLNTFGYTGGEEMRHYDKIHYVEDVKCLASMDLSIGKTGDENVPTFMDSLENILSQFS